MPQSLSNALLSSVAFGSREHSACLPPWGKDLFFKRLAGHNSKIKLKSLPTSYIKTQGMPCARGTIRGKDGAGDLLVASEDLYLR